MSKLISKSEIDKFNKDGAIFLKSKFDLKELEFNQDSCNILCHFDQFGVMQEKLGSLGIDIKAAEIQRIPHETKKLELNESLKILNIIDKFEEY